MTTDSDDRPVLERPRVRLADGTEITFMEKWEEEIEFLGAEICDSSSMSWADLLLAALGKIAVLSDQNGTT